MVEIFQDVATRNTFRGKFRFTIGKEDAVHFGTMSNKFFRYQTRAFVLHLAQDIGIRPRVEGVVDRIVGSVIRVHVVRHVHVQVGRLDVVYKGVSIGIGQFGTRSVLAPNLYIVIFDNSNIQNPRQIGRSTIIFCFCFLIDTRFSVMMSQWSVVGLAMSFFARLGFVTSARSIRYVVVEFRCRVQIERCDLVFWQKCEVSYWPRFAHRSSIKVIGIQICEVGVGEL